MNQCYGCTYLERQYDPDVGLDGPDICNAVTGADSPDKTPMEIPDGFEQWAIVLENILFKLSELNNCPMRKEARRTPKGEHYR